MQKSIGIVIFYLQHGLCTCPNDALVQCIIILIWDRNINAKWMMVILIKKYIFGRVGRNNDNQCVVCM